MEQGVSAGQGVRGSLLNKGCQLNKESGVSFKQGSQLNKESGVSNEQEVPAEQRVRGLY